MTKTMPSHFYYTQRLLRIHRSLIGAVSVIIFIGASASAIRIGNAPVLGPLVALIIMGLFFGIFYAVSKYIERGLFRGDPTAWIGSFLLSLCLCLFIIGIPATKELLTPEVRQHFF